MKLCCIYDKLRNTDRMTIRLDGFFGRAKGGGGVFSKYISRFTEPNYCKNY